MAETYYENEFNHVPEVSKKMFTSTIKNAMIMK